MKLFLLRNSKYLIFIQAILLVTTLYSTENEGRAALIIGNSNYEKVTNLRNPVNDTEYLSVSLKRLGFIVDTRLNAKKKEIAESLRPFGRQKLSARDRIGHREGYRYSF